MTAFMMIPKLSHLKTEQRQHNAQIGTQGRGASFRLASKGLLANGEGKGVFPANAFRRAFHFRKSDRKGLER